MRFQSTLSVRRATLKTRIVELGVIISIHALRKESDLKAHALPLAYVIISIHALRKESDLKKAEEEANTQISIHALRKESDFCIAASISAFLFQSTLSVRRATIRD